MTATFPAQRNFTFSKTLMNLKFMKRSTGDDSETTSAHSRLPATGQALTLFESNRREMELRQQLPGVFRVEEEYSLSRLYDLVLGRFSFHGINPQIESCLAGGDAEIYEEEENMESTQRFENDRNFSVDETIQREFQSRNKRKSDQMESEGPSDNEESQRETSPASKRFISAANAPRSRRGVYKKGGQAGRYFTAYSKNDGGRQNQQRKRGALPR
ncbi:hypothetical protein RvY_03366 [Ramazzottius varieornatus]|uniref:Uncharacterized protein n=1 Tax=Ramazzottius varieornatus TaxID=947166 RepID=A0A1D1UMU1_RAMVA|nr:hypothetical protein RvY_03366 [Ramazzottius varieornatus]